MAIVNRNRSAQYPLVAEFVWNYNDGFKPLAALNSATLDYTPKVGVTDFGSQAQPAGLMSGQTYTANDNASTKYMECFALPFGAQMIGGDFQIEVPYVGPSTATFALKSPNGLTLLAATSLEAGALGGTQTGAVSGAHVGQVVTLTVASGHGVAAGNTINVSGVTGAGAACYNGTYIVDAVTATTIVYTCSAAAAAGDTANTAAAGAGITNGAGITFVAGRTALTIPDEMTGPTVGQEMATGMDLRGVLTMSGGQAATQGRCRVRIEYTIDGRANEVQNT